MPSRPKAIFFFFFEKELPFRNSHRFLGLLLDRKLTWQLHIKDLRQRMQSGLSILKTVGSRNWGAERSTMLKLYHALLRSKIDYGAPIYGSAKSSLLESLEVIHRQAIRLCTGAFKSSPRESVLVEANEPPLSLRRIYQNLNYSSKVNIASSMTSHQKAYYLKPMSSKPLEIRVEIDLKTLKLNIPPHSSESLSKFPEWCLPNLTVRDELHFLGSKSTLTSFSIFKYL